MSASQNAGRGQPPRQLRPMGAFSFCGTDNGAADSRRDANLSQVFRSRSQVS